MSDLGKRTHARLRPTRRDRLMRQAASLLRRDYTPEQAARVLADMLDDAAPFGQLLPGPVGEAIELVDGPIIHAVVLAIVREAERRINAGAM